MVDLTSSFSLPSSLAEKPTVSAAMASLSGFSDDALEDACSICLEPFSSDDPATVTSCKHEYHLHCILEWSQRSKECPICWQLFVLKDPASQELLAAVESERCSRSRNVSSAVPTTLWSCEDVVEHDASHIDDSDFDERIRQHLAAAAARRARCVHRGVRQRSSGLGNSEVLIFASPTETQQRTYIPSVVPRDLIYGLSEGDSAPSNSPSEVHVQSPSSGPLPDVNLASSMGVDNEIPFKPRVLHTQTPSDNTWRTSPSEMFSITESIKSKLSATSARCKESISRSTRGMKERLLARNNSVKELSKGVQREMSAGIAGVSRIIERLDLNSRRNAASTPVSRSPEGKSSFFKGKNVQENVIAEALIERDVNNIPDSSSDATTYFSTTIPGAVEVSHAQGEH